MRPLCLKLKGFTSFRDAQELDFRALDVFAVTGPTGAGKSSLLDALTYALYGEVERVGRECSQLVSHGLTRMAVTLTFEVEGREYRITRSTPARTGPTKVQLEKLVGDAWVSYGEGADRVKECNEHVEQLIGLDYTAFTRSVLLSQGKFAEFMAGNPDERRALMTELLGLGLFRRMAQQAGRLASGAENEARIKAELVQTQYARATPEAVDAADVLARDAAARVARIGKAAEEVARLVGAWQAEQRRATELHTCAADLRTWRARLESTVSELRGLDARNQASARAALDAAATVAEAEAAALRGVAERTEAERCWGSPLELAPALVTAQRLPQLRARRAARLSEIGTLCERQASNVASFAELQAAQKRQAEVVACTEQQLTAARLHERSMQHAHMAAALAADLQVGDPCPVCGERLGRLPTAPLADELTYAQKQVALAEQAKQRAEQGRDRVGRQVDKMQHDLEEDERSAARLSGELTGMDGEVAAAEAEVGQALRGAVTDDPVRELEHRITSLAALGKQAEQAGAAHAAAVLAQAELTRSAADLGVRVATLRVTLIDPADALVKRATAALGTDQASSSFWPATPRPEAPVADLVEHGVARLGITDGLVVDLDRAAAQSAGAETPLLLEARTAIGDLLPESPSLATTEGALQSARIDLTTVGAESAQRATSLAEMLVQRTALEAEVGEHRTRMATYQALAQDLRQDHLLQFLQDEALATLAAVGSRYLMDLSSQRYELCVDREFFVIDKWAADEKRSVRTLSGGETFLASLALALALSEQVRMLSITQRSGLDSLFLDEGFGTLDADTLQVVVEAIERLSDGGGRLIGIITHVPELAENFQRVEVSKSPRGSHLQVAA